MVKKSNVAVISYNGLSKMLNCSNPTAIKVVKFATKHKIIKKKVSKARIGISKSGQGQFFAYGKMLSQPVNQYFNFWGKLRNLDTYSIKKITV